MISPNNDSLALVHEHLASGNTSKAKEICERFLQQYPGDREAKKLLGQIRKKLKIKERIQKTGKIPWRLNKHWSRNRIASDSFPSLISLSFLFAIIFLPAITASFFDVLGFMIVFFTLLISFGAYRFLEYTRFGNLYLKLDPFPGSLGGDAGGVLVLKVPYDESNSFSVSIRCFHLDYTYQRSHSSTSNRKSARRITLWEKTCMGKSETHPKGTLLQFRFKLPENLPESEMIIDKEGYHWRLSVSSKLRGVDLFKAFTIPVFKTGALKSTLRK